MKNDEPTAEDLADMAHIYRGLECNLDQVFQDLKDAAVSGHNTCQVKELNDFEIDRLKRLGFRVRDLPIDVGTIVEWG
jgi:hypothetical protein